MSKAKSARMSFYYLLMNLRLIFYFVFTVEFNIHSLLESYYRCNWLTFIGQS